MSSNAFEWDVVVVTCPTAEWAQAIKHELLLWQRNGKFGGETRILAVEDPEVGVGSGGATLNAILVAAEHLSAKRGFTVLHSDVFVNSHILIVHNGRQYPYEPCGKAFIPMPCSSAVFGFTTNLSRVLSVVALLRGASGGDSSSSPGSVWVCSTDALLTIPEHHPDVRGVGVSSDCVLYSIPCSPEYATHHGALKLINSGDHLYRVCDIFYRQPVTDLLDLTLPELNGKVAVVAGIVYLSPRLADSLLALHSQSPITSCTYFGTDSGSSSLQVSLFFDILAAMAVDIGKEKFVAGDCGKTYGIHRLQHGHFGGSMLRARRLVWKELRKYKLSSVVLKDFEHFYWSEHLSPLSHLQVLNQSRQDVSKGKDEASRFVCVNSVARFVEAEKCDETELSLVQNCILKGTSENPVSIGRRTIVSGLHWDASVSGSSLNIPANVFVMCTRVRLQTERPNFAVVVLGMLDDLNLRRGDPGATVCNLPWQSFLERTGISDEDLWDATVPDDRRTLLSARLFPVCSELCEEASVAPLSWWFAKGSLNDDANVETWRSQTRIALGRVLTDVDVTVEFAFRRRVSKELAQSVVDRVLMDDDDKERSLLPIFQKSVVEDWCDELLDQLDDVAAGCDKNLEHGRAARVLAMIAELLACQAANEGGLRNGPAAHKEWSSAFSILETFTAGSIRRGVLALRKRRRNWMDSPLRLVRAARHYEAASQILIHRAVCSANEFVRLTQSGELPQVGVWVVCECPARIDLSGGWTDTPPICYEFGGSVVNVSIRLDGKLPIGAKVRRTTAVDIQLHSDDGTSLTIVSLDDLLDYNQPSSAGALVKACIVYTKVVDIGGGTPLSQQLRQKFGGGFEMHTWSNVPRGSGLGTSSILAGAILTALWLVSGVVVADRVSIVHAVLCVEQMLTTGGGWQDQVGGLMGGVLHGTSRPSLPLKVDVTRLVTIPSVADTFGRHLVLVYTGKVRLAKNLLQNVLRNWFVRDATIAGAFRDLYHSSLEFIGAFQKGDLEAVGNLMDRYWSLKKVLAPGAEPAWVAHMMAHLRPYVFGSLLCGAGGGGYMVLLAREPDMHAFVRRLIDDLEGTQEVMVSEVCIDDEGLRAYVGGVRIEMA